MLPGTVAQVGTNIHFEVKEAVVFVDDSWTLHDLLAKSANEFGIPADQLSMRLTARVHPALTDAVSFRAADFALRLRAAGVTPDCSVMLKMKRGG